MVAGLDLALAIRPVRDQGKGNVLLQTKGIAFGTASDAVAEAAGVLASYLERRPIDDGKGNLPPQGQCGRLAVLGEQYSVTYRLAAGVLLLLVTPPSASSYVCAEVLDAATRTLAFCVGKASHLTAGGVAARFPEVYAAMDELLAGGVDRLAPGFRHAPLDDRLKLTMPVSASDAKRQWRKLMKTTLGSGDAASTGGDESQAGDEAGPTTPDSLDRRQSPLTSVSFAIPADALPPPPARATRRVLRPAAPPPPAALPRALEEAKQKPFEGAMAEPEEEEEAVQGQDTAEAETTTEQMAEQDEWATFEPDGSRPVTGDLGTEREAVAKAAAAAAVHPSAPALGDADVRASLQLVEVWRGKARGGRLVEAGVQGRVVRRLAPFGLARAAFRLHGPGEAVADACLRLAGVHPAFSARFDPAQLAAPMRARGGGGDGAPGGNEATPSAPAPLHPAWVATFHGAPMGTTYLQYRLPAAAVAPPLVADLRLVRTGTDGALGVLRWAVDPELSGGLFDVVADLALPHGLELARASSKVQWRGETCQVRLPLPRLAPGESGELSLLFTGAARMLRDATASAVVTFTGMPGGVLSGTRLQVGRGLGSEDVTLAGHALFFGRLEVLA